MGLSESPFFHEVIGSFRVLGDKASYFFGNYNFLSYSVMLGIGGSDYLTVVYIIDYFWALAVSLPVIAVDPNLLRLRFTQPSIK